MNDTTEPKRPMPIISLRTGDLITRAWTILKKSKGQVVFITLFGMILPQLGFTWILGHKADLAFDEIKAITAAGKADPGVQVFYLALEATFRFVSTYGVLLILLWGVMLTAYTAFVQIALDRLRRKMPRTTGGLLRNGLKLTLTRTFWATFFSGLILAFSQVFPPIAVVVAVLSTMIPVLAVAENGGPIRILWRSLTLRFAPKTRLGRWPVFFAMLSLGGVFYLSEFGLSLLVEYSNTFDESLFLPAFLMSRAVSGFPFSPIFALADLIDTMIGISLLPLLAASTAVLYVRIQKLGDLKELTVPSEPAP